jgi:hypothetical protein
MANRLRKILEDANIKLVPGAVAVGVAAMAAAVPSTTRR